MSNSSPMRSSAFFAIADLFDAEVIGQPARFLSVYEKYKKAPEVYSSGEGRLARECAYGVVPFLSLEQLQKRKEGGN